THPTQIYTLSLHDALPILRRQSVSWTASADGLEELVIQLAQRIQGKYYGKYRGFVVDNADPDHIGRLKLRVPSVLGTTELDWARSEEHTSELQSRGHLVCR